MACSERTETAPLSFVGPLEVSWSTPLMVNRPGSKGGHDRLERTPFTNFLPSQALEEDQRIGAKRPCWDSPNYFGGRIRPADRRALRKERPPVPYETAVFGIRPSGAIWGKV